MRSKNQGVRDGSARGRARGCESGADRIHSVGLAEDPYDVALMLEDMG